MTLIAAIATILVLSSAAQLEAQTWTGLYVGGAAGGGFQRGDTGEMVEFDTDLNGEFGDVIRTAAGADAFAPGFCAGLAAGPTPGAGCAEDEDGIDFGGRLGYDWQMGRIVFGGVTEVSRADLRDSVTAFSITPAFYAFDRKLTSVGALRARVGVGTERMLLYGTGGGAWGRIDRSFTTSNAVNTFVPADADTDNLESETMVSGYQAGGGLEIRFGARVSLLGEYLFTSLDDRDESAVRVQGPAPATNPFILVNAAGSDLRRTDVFDFHAARVGILYRF